MAQQTVLSELMSIMRDMSPGDLRILQSFIQTRLRNLAIQDEAKTAREIPILPIHRAFFAYIKSGRKTCMEQFYDSEVAKFFSMSSLHIKFHKFLSEFSVKNPDPTDHQWFSLFMDILPVPESLKMPMNWTTAKNLSVSLKSLTPQSIVERLKCM
jgi:hypothetical protein